jgi:outer membrane protein OmpA-like peptidoglycan-associated protein
MRPSIPTAARLLAGGLILVVPCDALADTWLVAEAPAALAVSDAQDGVFRPGAMPAVGIYADNQRFALGLRMRAGVLRNGPAPGRNLEDPGVGGLTTAGLAFRVSAYSGWAELVVGGGVTGRDLVPAIEAGVGWSFAAGSLDVGPSIRYVRVVSRDSMDAFGTAELALVGIDVRFGKQRATRPIGRVASARVGVVEPPLVLRDKDRAIDLDASCIDQLDGCSIAGGAGETLGEDIVILDDRIVIDERVLFDFNRARVRTRGRKVIVELMKIWKEHADWQHITIEGHADARGSDEYNLELSQIRADRVREVMVQLGCSADSISAIGFGRARVRDSGNTDEAHQRNRRVEFVIQRGGVQ